MSVQRRGERPLKALEGPQKLLQWVSGTLLRTMQLVDRPPVPLPVDVLVARLFSPGYPSLSDLQMVKDPDPLVGSFRTPAWERAPAWQTCLTPF